MYEYSIKGLILEYIAMILLPPEVSEKYHGLLATVKIGTLLGRTNISEGWSGPVRKREGERKGAASLGTCP